MGKSSVLMRTIGHALELGKRVALIDFQLFDEPTMADAGVFFRRFASAIAEQLELPDKVDGEWQPTLAAAQACTQYVSRHVLEASEGPLVIGIDEADAVFRSTFATEFFGMLRSWHASRANPIRRRWRFLDIVLTTSTSPVMFIENAHSSAFNVGISILVEDFLLDQVSTLNGMHPRPVSEGDVERLYRLTHGQPFLIRQALYLVAGQTPAFTTDGLLARCTNDMGPFGDHLRNILLRLYKRPELLQALREVLGHGSADDTLLYRLQAEGLITRESGNVRLRCELYEQYLRERLLTHGQLDRTML